MFEIGDIVTVVKIAATSCHYNEWVKKPEPFQVKIHYLSGQEMFKARGLDGYYSLSFNYLDGREHTTGFIYGALLDDNYTTEPDWEI